MRARRTLTTLASFAFCLLGLGAGGAAAATPGEVTTFPIGPCFEGGIAATPSGAYVRSCSEGDFGSSTILAKLLPDGGSTAITVPASGAGPIAIGPAGEVWLGARDPETVAGEAERIERIAPDGSAQSFPLAPAEHPRVFHGLVVDKHGVAWAAIGAPYTVDNLLDAPPYDLGELMSIAPDGSERHFPLTPGTEPQGLAIGPGGGIWFTAISGSRAGWKISTPGYGSVGHLSPNGRIRMFPTPIEHSNPTAIAFGPDGELWFAEWNGSAIGTVSARGKFGREYDVRSLPMNPSLTFGPEGDLWVPLGKGLLRMTPPGRRTFYPGRAEAVASAGDGSIWALGWTQVRRMVPGPFPAR
jgi:virginiamycin B lyase